LRCEVHQQLHHRRLRQVDDVGELGVAHFSNVLELRTAGEQRSQNAFQFLRAQDQLELVVDPRQATELEKVDLEVSVGVYALHDPLDLGLAVRKSLGAQDLEWEAGKVRMDKEQLRSCTRAGCYARIRSLCSRSL
jgi:hypothetical protein